MTIYFVDEKEIDKLTYCKDIQTRIKLANIIKSKNKSSKTDYYSKNWMELKEWLRATQQANEIQYMKLHSVFSSARASMCNFIASRMDAIDKENHVDKSNIITMWFSGKDCKKCGNHIYTDGIIDWCREGCPKHGNPADWRE